MEENSVNPTVKKTRALFLDRDGVINVDKGYVYQFEQFDFVDGIFELLLRFQKAGYLPVVVTNQSGIARGMYEVSDFKHLMNKVQEVFTSKGIVDVPVYFCPHHPDQGDGKFTVECQCRKPKAGMFYDAVAELNIDVENSIMIGDSWRDIVAAQTASVSKHYFLRGKPIPQNADMTNVDIVEGLNEIQP
ncbi:HAD family hydrolase [Alteromonas sp. KUL49]|nr:HAD family hydrolase [Alteromonas sp. KUL49]